MSKSLSSFLSVLGLTTILMIAYQIAIHTVFNTDSFVYLYPHYWNFIEYILYCIRSFNGSVCDWIYYFTGIDDPGFYAVFVAPVIEELQFRGPILLLRNNKSPTIKYGACLFSTLLFAMCHPVPLVYGCFIFIIGLLCCYLTLKTEHLYFPMCFHAFYNANLLMLAGAS